MHPGAKQSRTFGAVLVVSLAAAVVVTGGEVAPPVTLEPPPMDSHKGTVSSPAPGLTTAAPGLTTAAPGLTTVATAPAAGGSGPATARLWAGHQVVAGQRRAPILGDVAIRTETWFLAEIEENGDGLVIRQRSCRVEIAKAAGVRVSMDPKTPPRLPVVPARFVPDGDRVLAAPRWVADFGDADVDRDGHPGLTLHVKAPFCSGEIRVASRSVSRARIRRGNDIIVGSIEVHNSQRILDTTSMCLSMFARDSNDVVSGTFAYVPVSDTATCETLGQRPAWPVQAPEEAVDRS